METLNHCILVPYDFTPPAMNAVAHAVSLAKVLETKITLLHIVKKDAEVPEMEQQIKEEAQKINEIYNVLPNTLVREGSIFRTINQVAHELEAILVVMVTHGMKGLQKLTGSWALKVIVGSKVPFLVVQDPPKSAEIKKIVFPVDFKTENKEKLKWAQFMAKYFPSKILLFSAVRKALSIPVPRQTLFSVNPSWKSGKLITNWFCRKTFHPSARKPSIFQNRVMRT